MIQHLCAVLAILHALLPRGVNPTTIPANQLFKNTITRWGIRIEGDLDKSERWARFIEAKAAVDRTTTGRTLHSLNRFTVLNDAEYEAEVVPLMNLSNSTLQLLEDMHHSSSRRLKRDTELPTTYNFWEDDVGLQPTKDQLSCGSCWSFPTVGAYEALYKNYTGEDASFSEQYFVDCTFEGDGCGGGSINDGFQLTSTRQYLMYTDDWPYTADYSVCTFGDDIATFTNNAMTKMWHQATIPLSTTEDGMLSGLLHSPVAFGSYISTDILSYSGGEFEDVSCASEALAHAMMLVGYTETTLRVKNSYGSDWGEDGYVNYIRGASSLSACSFYKTAFAIKMTYRRELEYAFCLGASVGTWGECRTSCDEMNTETETGWTLAIIPSLYHNSLLQQMVDGAYPGVKSNDKFNYVWIGLKDTNQDQDYVWMDGYTPVNYANNTENIGKYGMLNKNTGNWAFKNSLTYDARGLCSRPVTCWDIGTAVAHGTVTFDQTPLVEGTVGTVECNDGYTLSGEDTLTCAGGLWDESLPTCTCLSGDCDTDDSSSDDSSSDDSSSDDSSSDDSSSDDSSSDDSSSDDSSSTNCTEITVENGSITPTQPVASGTTITVTCDSGYTLTGDSELACSDDGSYSGTTPTCEQEECNELSVINGILTPDSEGSVVTVACINGYELIGDSELSCDLCLENTDTDTVLCSGSSFSGEAPSCRLKPGSCPGGTYYTNSGCETCPAGHWLAAGDNAETTTDGCNTCPHSQTSNEGADSEEACFWTLCTCRQLASTNGVFKTSCHCL